jgi:hypothetical protein
MKYRDYSITFANFTDYFRYMMINLDDQFPKFKFMYNEFKKAFKYDTGLEPMKNYNKFYGWLWSKYPMQMQLEYDMWYDNELELLNFEFDAIISSIYRDTGYLEYSYYFMVQSNNRHIKTDLICYDNMQDLIRYLYTIIDNGFDEFEIRFIENGIKSEVMITFGNTTFYLEPYYTYILNTGFIKGIIFNYSYTLEELIDCFEIKLGVYIDHEITRLELIELLLESLSQKPAIAEGFIINQDHFDNMYQVIVEYLNRDEK